MNVAKMTKRDRELFKDAVSDLKELYPILRNFFVARSILGKVEILNSGNDQNDYEHVRNQVERLAAAEEKTLRDYTLVCRTVVQKNESARTIVARIQELFEGENSMVGNFEISDLRVPNSANSEWVYIKFTRDSYDDLPYIPKHLTLSEGFKLQFQSELTDANTDDLIIELVDGPFFT